MDPIQTPRSSRASSVTTPPNPTYKPTNDDIEAVIQMATSARPTPDGRPVPPRDTRTQLFVGNLPYRVRWQDLKDLFRRAGTVLRADVSLGPDNRSRGYGTVLLATAEDAGRAVDMFNGYSWQTRILEVRPDRLPPDLDNPLGSMSGPAVTLATVANPLTSVLQSSVHGPSPPLNLQKRADELEYASLFGAHDMSVVSGGIGRGLFVGNLPFHCQWQDLKDLFRQAGTIIRADVALGSDGRSRGFGTVTFASESDAEHAMKIFNGYEYNGRILKVHFDKYMQLGQTISYPASPSLHAITSPVASLTSTALNALNNTPSFGVSYPSQVLQAKVHSSYSPDFSSRSRSSSPPELYQIPAPASQHQRRIPPFPAAQSPPMVDISLSLGSTRLTSETALVNSSPIKQSPASESPSTSASSSASRAPSVSASHANNSTTEKAAEKTVSPSHHHHHPHRPGPITLPPPPVPFPLALHKLSNLNESTPSAQTPVFNSQFALQQAAPATPHGLPPITPSMPPFTFLPPPLSSPQYPPQTHGLPDTPGIQTYASGLFTQSQIPSPLDHPSSPAYGVPYALTGFSPGGAMSPGAFYGRPGNPNPHINPAVGAPVHAPHSNGPANHVHAISSPNRLNRRNEPTSYFDLEYFPHDITHPSYVSSSLANEILRDKDETSSGDGHDDDLRSIDEIDQKRDVNLVDQRDNRDRSRSRTANGLRDTSYDIHQPRRFGGDGQLSAESESSPSSVSSNWPPSRDELI